MNTNENNSNIQKHQRNRILAGVVLVAIGVVLFADKMGVLLPHWLLTWPMLLIVIGLYTGIKHNFRNATWIILVFVGSIFLWDEIMADISLKKFTIPIILVGAGLLTILRPRFVWGGGRQRLGERRRERWNSYAADAETSTFKKEFEEASPLSDDYIDVNCVFSGVKKTVISKTFKGGRISCIFGGAELDLTKADIQGTAVLQLNEVFGGVTLVVPSNWTVQNNIDGVFQGVDDSRSSNGQNDENKLLILQGSIVMAGVEIKSY